MHHFSGVLLWSTGDCPAEVFRGGLRFDLFRHILSWLYNKEIFAATDISFIHHLLVCSPFYGDLLHKENSVCSNCTLGKPIL